MEDHSGIYYFTKTKLINIIPGNNGNTLLSNLLFTDHTKITFSLQSKGILIASYTQQKLFELFSIEEGLIFAKEYPNENITEYSILDKCGLAIRSDFVRIIQIFYKQPDGNIKIKWCYFSFCVLNISSFSSILYFVYDTIILNTDNNIDIYNMIFR